jgi:16S rRNA (guanine966-N2)-methyltransferase
LRIIAGQCKGRKLISLPGMHTRPTSGRVRESIFSILSSEVPNRHVLDLFAGTGAMGLEALSRGAASACFTDNTQKNLSVIRENIRRCRQEKHCRLFCRDILKNLYFLQAQKERFDLVFIDPPYQQQMAAKVLENLMHSHALAPDAKIVLEHSRTEKIPENIPDLEMKDQRRYGKSFVSFFTYKGSEDSPENSPD